MSNIIITDRRGNPVDQRAVINTSTSSAPANWLLNLTNGMNSTGIHVTRELAFTVSAFRKGLFLVCNAVAKCPTNVYSMRGNVKTLNQSHPAYRLMRYKPNRFQRAFDFKQQMQLHLLLYGNAYAAIILDNDGNPVELLPLLPDTVSIIDKPQGRYYQATLFYSDGHAETYTLDSSQMLHISDLSYDGITGRGLIQDAREVLGQMIAMQSHAGSFFKNGGRPGSVLKHPGRLTPDGKKSLRDSYDAAYTGTNNAYKTLVLDEGMDLQMVGQTAKDSQMVELWQQCVRDVANFFGLPPSKLGDNSRSAYNSLEQDALAALSDCFDPHIVNWEEALNEKLLSTLDQMTGSNLFIFDRASLLSADLKAKAEFVARGLGNNTPWMTQNEGRAFFDLNPLDGTADVLPLPTAGQQGPQSQDDNAGQEDDDDDSEDDARAAALEVLRDAIQRASTKTLNEIKRAHNGGGVAAALQSLASGREGREKIINAAARTVAALSKRNADVFIAEIHGAINAKLFDVLSRNIGALPEVVQGELEKTGESLTAEIMKHAY